MVTSDPRGFNGEFVSTDHTCNSKKGFIHITKVIASSTPTSSASVELLVLIYCFVDIDSILPCPKLDRLLCDSYSLVVLQMKHQYSKLVFHYHLHLQLYSFFQITDNIFKFLIVLFYWRLYPYTQECYTNLYVRSCSLTCK